ncbi:MAG: helix-turn-helix domain-containing protein [Prevotella sp.]|nr:helix-turn-helix domain-containing protein [Prevotella sp.]
MKSKVLDQNKVLRTLLTLVTLFMLLSSNAQTGKLFDADKYLSSSFVSQLYIDHDGFIWIATRNGLNRYDGYQTYVLKKEKEQALGMASNYVNCLMQDHNGLFYIGMWGHLQTFNGYQFRNIKVYDLQQHETPPYVTCLVERSNGEICAGTSGHGLLRLTGPEEAHQVGGALKDIIGIHRMAEDRQHRLWLLTEEQGLICYDGQKAHRYFEDETLRTQLRSVCIGEDGNIYVGMARSGMYVLRSSGHFEHIAITADLPVVEIYSNHKGELLLGYDGKGFGIYNPQTGVLKNNPFYSRDIDLSLVKCYSIVEDQMGNTWFGLLQKGVYMQPRTETPFHYMGFKLGTRNQIGEACVTSVLIDSRGWTWVGTDKDGLYSFDEHDQPVYHYKDNFPSTILGLTEDKEGRVWIGSFREGCGWIDHMRHTYHRQQLPQGTAVSIFDLECDPDGNLWLGTMGEGLLRLTPSTGSVKAYTTSENAGSNRKENSIVNNYISQISLSPDKRRIYVATTMGVCAMELATENWLSTFNGQNCPNYGTAVRIAREFGSKLRIGTNDGLFCYDLKSHKMEHHGIEDGLANNGISSIEEDHEKNLWIATDHGLCCIDTKTQLTTSYFVDNGLQGNEFSDGASCVSAKGTVLFGGVGGVTWFTPTDIHQSEWKADVKLTAFFINGEPVTPESKSGWYQVTDTTVIASKRFALSAGDNSFTIQLSTLTYDNPEHIIYSYRINHEEWVRMQPGINEITFSHMAPGNYDFCVVAQRNNQTTEERCFTVFIHAPWYRTWLAYITYLLILGFIAWKYLHYRRQQEQNRLRLQEHIHAEEMGEAKLRFFMNISHEIRTPMTLIVSPLLSLMKQDDDPHRRSVYETIRRNAERILGLINQMMDLRKIDKGLMQMRMCETDLISFVGDIHTLFTQQAKAKNIRFSYEHDTQMLPIWIDRDNFDKVVVNILSNAFKFTPPGGVIRISLSHDDRQATIAIYDSGEQIPEDKLERIFERFYQSPSSVNDRKLGTGIGLDLTRSLVELHHGTISAHNNPDGEGCEFVVTIPLGNSHLKPEEMITEKEDVAHSTSLFDEVTDDAPIVTELPKASRQQRIIIAEDDQEIRDYLVQELSNDYKVIACENGKEALTEVLKSIPDLLISDIMMPEMDGNTLCAKVKSNPATGHIPVILLTAKNRDEDQLEGLATGADAYIVKPFNMDILRRSIVNLIHTHHMLRLKYGRNDRLEEKVDEVQMKSPDDKLLERIMQVINKNISNADLSVDSIADEVGISRVHLHRKMKELTGQTPHDFIRNIRLKQAANLLANQSMNITEVMYACGFNNAASFSTIFKKFYGMSPREYMNEHKSEERAND